MVKRIGFWREVQNSYGVTCHSTLKTFTVPDDVPDSQALDVAKREFSDWAHVDSWHEAASGYEVQYLVDDRRTHPRPDASNYWYSQPVH